MMIGHGHGLVTWGFLEPARKHKNKNEEKLFHVILTSHASNIEMMRYDDNKAILLCRVRATTHVLDMSDLQRLNHTKFLGGDRMNSLFEKRICVTWKW